MEAKFYSLRCVYSFMVIEVLYANVDGYRGSMSYTGMEIVPCKSGQVLNGSRCINITECTLPVLSNRRCLQRCPVGYIYITMMDDSSFLDYPKYHYTLDDIDDDPCYNVYTFYVLIVLFGILNVAYVVLVKMFLSTNKYSVEKLKILVCCKSQNGERHRLLNVNTDEDASIYSSIT